MSAAQQTAEEVRSVYIERMGQELGELFHATSEELTQIHWRWNEYRTLFGEKPSRIDLMNEAAPFFFGLSMTYCLRTRCSLLRDLWDQSNLLANPI